MGDFSITFLDTDVIPVMGNSGLYNETVKKFVSNTIGTNANWEVLKHYYCISSKETEIIIRVPQHDDLVVALKFRGTTRTYEKIK